MFKSITLTVVTFFVFCSLTAQELKPKFFGTLKADYEADISDGYSRFNVRNARLGTIGNINPLVGYMFQIEFSGSGKLTVLDVEAIIKPAKKLKLHVGQFGMPFAETWVISASRVPFSSVPLVYPYASAQARDIGFRADYKIKTQGYPIAIIAGLFNGKDINNTQWQKSPSLASNLILGSLDKGLRTSIKYYADLGGKQGRSNYGLGFQYTGQDTITNGPLKMKRYEIQAEWNMCDSTGINRNYKMHGLYIQGGYAFKINSQSITYLKPVTRFDCLGKDILKNGIAGSRVTFGANLGLDVKNVGCEFRLNVEKFMTSNMANLPPQMLATERSTHDRIILELFMNF